MPKISYCFRGWIRNANVLHAYSPTMGEVDVSKMPREKLTAKLKSGELLLSLKGTMDYAEDSEVELHDFE